MLALGAAAVLLLLVVGPRLHGRDRASLPHWTGLDEDEIPAPACRVTPAPRICVLSVIATGKFRQPRHAVDPNLAAAVSLI
ncbi:hypothetical protein ACFC01_49745 [Streptomyces mirabilis]|uniref:hypothetical protein n=1 Tax=Streptomyces mirabilis TaxID=68239 RepID=UPI0035DD205C